MSNFFNQVGQFSQSLGSQMGQLGHNLSHTLGSSVNQALQQGLPTTMNEELRVGSHTVLVKDRLAEGGFGLVMLVTELHTQKEMVLKRCNVDREEVFNIVRKEINILQRFTGPYIAKLIESDVAPVPNQPHSREALLLLEFYPGGHLLHRLNTRQGSFLPGESIYRIFGQILMGVKSLHENNPPIIHRDLKLENILFGTDGKVRLCDFGSCEESPIYVRNQREREKADDGIQKETTQMYRAPEMINLYMREQLTEKTDIWALGCIFYALCFLKHPFQDVGSLAILQAKYSLPSEHTVSTDAIEFLQRMLDIDPEARPSVAELLTALVEIAAGRPIPPYQLSAEALKRREERLAADQLRETKNKKKTAPPVPQRKGAPPAMNSVAAKRLAAKRGQPITASSGENTPMSNQSFEPFADFTSSTDNSPRANPSTSSRPTSVRRPSNDLFDDDNAGNTFSEPVSTSSAARQNSSSTDFFNNDFSENDGGFDGGFSQATSSKVVGGFDPFSDNEVQSSTPFGSSLNAFAENEPEDDFWGNHDNATASQPTKHGVRKPSFEEFTPTTHTATKSTAPPASQARSQPSFSGFDEFDDDPTPFANNDDAFGSQAQSVAFDKDQNDFPSPSKQSPAPSSAALLFDAVDSDFAPSQPPNTRQNSTVRDSFNTPPDFGMDFSLPQAPPSRQSSISTAKKPSIHKSDGGFGIAEVDFGSTSSSTQRPPSIKQQSLHQDLFDFGSNLPPAEVLTPTPTSTIQTHNASSSGDLLGDLLDSAPSSQPQRKSVNLHNPMELLSLYDQPKPEQPSKPSAMLSNSKTMSEIPFLAPSHPPSHGMMMNHPAMMNPGGNYYGPAGGAGYGMNAPPRPTGQGFGMHPYGGGAAPGMMSGNAGYGGGSSVGGRGHGGYSSSVPPPNPFAPNNSASAPSTHPPYSNKIGSNPNTMRPTFGAPADPFDSLNMLNNNNNRR